jgi:hypothetical protein
MWKPTRTNAIHGQQAGSFSISYDEYSNKRKSRPPIGGDMTDNVPLIALLGFHTLKVEQIQREMHMLDLNQLKFQYITDKMGEKTAVILPIQEFQELLEDIEDLAAVAERREEPRISHDELLAELRRDGLL